MTKHFGRHRAVDALTFDVQRGRITGFLGPNGAGKTTTMRMILGLATPTDGSSLVLGRPYSDLDRPASGVGVLLDPGTFHPMRTARNHLRWMAAAAGVRLQRVDQVLATVGLESVSERQVREFSTGMRQRLGLAAALLAEPELLVLDEPANGLDPAGIRWLREFLRSFAADGGSVFVSSHVLPEVAQVADEVVVINRGRLVTHMSVEELTAGRAGATRVRTPDGERLRAALAEAGAEVTDEATGGLNVRGVSTERVGEIAAAGGVVLHELTGTTQSLEEVFFELTAEERGDV
ncbi:MAG: ATP-binding cassette domain-containing protein [Actinomycetota bacterium]|nr:ATP-binding cassette domain-containing protein [Actinomycetota bacterium]